MADIVKTVKLKEDFSIPAPPLPDALTTVGVSYLANLTDVRLGWVDPGVNADSYDIEYGVDPLFLTKTQINIPSTPGSGGFEDILGMPLQLFDSYYRIRARNVTGVSAWVTVMFPIPVPDALINLVTTPVSANRIDLFWDDPGPWATGYEIDYATAPFNTNPVYSALTQISNPNGPSSRQINGLVAATTYYFRIRAVAGVLASAYTLDADATL